MHSTSSEHDEPLGFFLCTIFDTVPVFSYLDTTATKSALGSFQKQQNPYCLARIRRVLTVSAGDDTIVRVLLVGGSGRNEIGDASLDLESEGALRPVTNRLRYSLGSFGWYAKVVFGIFFL
jgi:hypothetical protein